MNAATAATYTEMSNPQIAATPATGMIKYSTVSIHLSIVLVFLLMLYSLC